ncbi:hypothetical protein [Demequina soli]|uniref:hypothetical protein n=1 Tax=Demequina soli TaxID=1638987 RepID=UPI000782AFCC|nr:hypothetical protein [Demequina soli]
MTAANPSAPPAAPKAVGGASGAVASSAHAGCARFRGTDPLITGRSRRQLASDLGHADSSGAIPEARWIRAMTFERLLRREDFASRIAVTTAGGLDLARPDEVVTVHARANVRTTARLLADAHVRATGDGVVTIVFGLAVPFVGFDVASATAAKPDFAVVIPKADCKGSWLVVGDAKDYERLRSRIDDARLLKGFLQVAVGAECMTAWSQLPAGMEVHTHGVLAVPRNSFLLPRIVVENLHDHRQEVLARIEQRRDDAEKIAVEPDETLAGFVAHLEATFDPATCATCSLFSYCRERLRASNVTADLLVEIGVPRASRPAVAEWLADETDGTALPATVTSSVTATTTGAAVATGRRRTDVLGDAGTIEVVIAKSEAAALGVHGFGMRRTSSAGQGEWAWRTFADAQTLTTRLAVMEALGAQIDAAVADQAAASPEAPQPIHVVTPDSVTADMLVSIADSLAGVEISRLRWKHDVEAGREPLTFDGAPAEMPMALSAHARTAVSFLLEADRARASSSRAALVNARDVLAGLVTAGGAPILSGRLDYLLAWANADGSVDHRAVADSIESRLETPGARLSNRRSDDLHRLLPRTERSGDGAGPYRDAVLDELRYKADTLDATIVRVQAFPRSALAVASREVEARAQAVWRRRLAFHANDLVRFGRTARFWRVRLVKTHEKDGAWQQRVDALVHPGLAHDRAVAPGTRELSLARVVSVSPLVLDVGSRRFVSGTRVVALHLNGAPLVEEHGVAADVRKDALHLAGMAVGELDRFEVDDDASATHLAWHPLVTLNLAVGDRIVLADHSWLSAASGDALAIELPPVDDALAPKSSCLTESYGEDPGNHQWCCKPHEVYEAEQADSIAKRRAKGELNPEVWPPVTDGDAFDALGTNEDGADAPVDDAEPMPDGLTIDDLE